VVTSNGRYLVVQKLGRAVKIGREGGNRRS